MQANGAAIKDRASDNPIATLTEDISAIKRDLGAVVRRGGEVASERATHLMNGAADGARELTDRARRRAVAAQDRVESFASDRPFTTIVIAAVSGAVIAALLSRTARR